MNHEEESSDTKTLLPLQTPVTTIKDNDLEIDISKYRFLQFLYFLNGVSGSTWYRFAAIYYNLKGLTPSQIGIIEGAMPIVRTIATPIWGVLSDCIHSKKKIYLFTKVCSTCALMLFAFPYISKSFIELLLISCLTSCFVSWGVLDAYTVEVTKGSKTLYGRIRLFLALSYGLGSMGMAVITDHFGFDWNFILYAVLSISSILLTSWGVPDQTQGEKERSKSGSKPKIKSLLRNICNFNALWFFSEVLIAGMCIGIIDRLLFVYLQQELHASTTFCGIVTLTTVLFELPVFFYAGKIIDFLGHDLSMASSLFCYAIRTWGYTLITPDTLGYILFFELLHGICYSLMWSSAVAQAKELCSSEWQTTSQSIVTMIFTCIGQGSGSFLGGYFMERHGAKWMYLRAAIIVGSMSTLRLIYIFITFLQRKFGNTPPDINQGNINDMTQPIANR